MNRKNLGIFSGVLLLAGLMFPFQNCGKGFSSATAGVESSSSVTNPGNSNLLEVQPSAAMLYSYDDLNFKVTGVPAADVASIKWSSVFSGTTPCLYDVSDTDPTVYGVNCTVPGSLIVTVSSTGADGSTLSKSLVSTVLANPSPPPTGGTTVTFTIAAGTGSKPWNLSTAPIELYIGQTLTITNGDTVDHQLHVDRYDSDTAMNGHPCLHEPDPMPPGGSYNCVVTKTYDPAVDPIIWDHLNGTNARFYLKAYDGSALYTQNCSGCHGALASSSKLGKTAAQITTAIGSEAPMKAVPALMQLTAVQIQAIAFALKP